MTLSLLLLLLSTDLTSSLLVEQVLAKSTIAIGFYSAVPFLLSSIRCRRACPEEWALC